MNRTNRFFNLKSGHQNNRFDEDMPSCEVENNNSEKDSECTSITRHTTDDSNLAQKAEAFGDETRQDDNECNQFRLEAKNNISERYESNLNDTKKKESHQSNKVFGDDERQDTHECSQTFSEDQNTVKEGHASDLHELKSRKSRTLKQEQRHRKVPRKGYQRTAILKTLALILMVNAVSSEEKMLIRQVGNIRFGQELCLQCIVPGQIQDCTYISWFSGDTQAGIQNNTDNPNKYHVSTEQHENVFYYHLCLFDLEPMESQNIFRCECGFSIAKMNLYDVNMNISVLPKRVEIHHDKNKKMVRVSITESYPSPNCSFEKMNIVNVTAIENKTSPLLARTMFSFILPEIAVQCETPIILSCTVRTTKLNLPITDIFNCSNRSDKSSTFEMIVIAGLGVLLGLSIMLVCFFLRTRLCGACTEWVKDTRKNLGYYRKTDQNDQKESNVIVV